MALVVALVVACSPRTAIALESLLPCGLRSSAPPTSHMT
jgi:hypothetical protein